MAVNHAEVPDQGQAALLAHPALGNAGVSVLCGRHVWFRFPDVRTEGGGLLQSAVLQRFRQQQQPRRHRWARWMEEAAGTVIVHLGLAMQFCSFPPILSFTDCSKQDERFSLVFTVASFLSNFLCLLNGYLFDRFGTMATRLLAMWVHLLFLCLKQQDITRFCRWWHPNIPEQKRLNSIAEETISSYQCMWPFCSYSWRWKISWWKDKKRMKHLQQIDWTQADLCWPPWPLICVI